MYDVMVPSNGGLQEVPNRADPIPPIRVSPKRHTNTKCVVISRQN